MYIGNTVILVLLYKCIKIMKKCIIKGEEFMPALLTAIIFMCFPNSSVT